MTNVFKFPEHKIVREVPVPIEEVEKAKEKGRQNYADGVVGEICLNLYAELENYGVDSNSEEFNKDFLFLSDVLKAIVYRSMSLEHSLHKFIDENVTIKTVPPGASKEDIQKILDDLMDDDDTPLE